MVSTLNPTKETVLTGWRDNEARLLIAGKAKDGLFIHVAVGVGSAWSVSHIGSGRHLAAFRIEFNAYAFAENLLHLTDWTMVAGPDDISPDLLAAVREAAALFEDCSLNYA